MTGPVPPVRGVINGTYSVPQARPFYGGQTPSVPAAVGYQPRSMSPAANHMTDPLMPNGNIQSFPDQSSTGQPSTHQPLSNQPYGPQPGTNQTTGMNLPGLEVNVGMKPLPPRVSSYDPNRYFDQHPNSASDPQGSLAQQRLMKINSIPAIRQVGPRHTKAKEEKKEFYDVEVEKGSSF